MTHLHPQPLFEFEHLVQYWRFLRVEPLGCGCLTPYQEKFSRVRELDFPDLVEPNAMEFGKGLLEPCLSVIVV